MVEIQLRVRGLEYVRGGHRLLRGVDLEIAAGEAVFIFGRSGAGKSTLLDLICAEDNAQTRGSIELDRRHAAELPQDGALFEHLDVLDNLRVVQRWAGLGDDRGGAARALLEKLRIDPGLHRRAVSTLSGGERRRVAIARALVRNPRVMLFDEPDAGLDVGNLRALAELLRELLAEGRSLLVVSHNALLAALLASRIVVLEQGRLREIGRWGSAPAPGDEPAIQQRRASVEKDLVELAHAPAVAGASPGAPSALWRQLVLSLGPALGDLVPRSPVMRDYLAVFGQVMHKGLITALPFLLLVGAMFGATTVAAIEILRTHSGGLVALLATPHFVLKTFRASYIAYMSPAVAGILFAARSGGILTAWLAGLGLSGQRRAMAGLGIDPRVYLRRPVTGAVFTGAAIAGLVVAAGMWLGSYVMAYYGLGITDAARLLTFDGRILELSQALWKLPLYAFLCAWITAATGMAPVGSHTDIARLTAGNIIYTTGAIAVLELGFALAT